MRRRRTFAGAVDTAASSAACDLGEVPAAMEEPEVAHYTDRRKLVLCECANAYYMYFRDPDRPRCLACCKATGRLRLLPKSGIPRPVRATHAAEFDAYLGRFEPRMPGLPWKLALAESTEHVGHAGAGGDSVRAVTSLQLLPLNWYRPMTRSRVDALPPDLLNRDAAGPAGYGQFYTEFEGHLKFYFAGVCAEEGAECGHLDIECRHLACCGSRAQLFYSPTGDVTRREAAAELEPRRWREPRILSSVQEYLWNWFVIPDIGDLRDAEFDHWLHPVVQGFAFTGVEKDEATGACCSLTVMTRLSQRRCGLRTLRAGADVHGRTAGARQCEQQLEWATPGAHRRRQRLSAVWHCAQLPLLMSRDLPATGAAAPTPVSLHPDARAQSLTVRRWLASRPSDRPLLLLRPSESPLGRLRWENFGQLNESVEAAFAQFRRHLASEPATSAWSYLELPAEADAALATVAACAGCHHLVAEDGGGGSASPVVAAVSRQAFDICLLDLETFETAMSDIGVLAQAALLEQLRRYCGAPGPEAAVPPRYVRGLLHLAEHAWQLAGDAARLAETQLVTDRPAHWIDDQASISSKSDAWLHLDLLTQLTYDLTQRRPRTPETLLAACALSTWPTANRSLHHADWGLASPPESPAEAAPSSRAQEFDCFTWLASAFERALHPRGSGRGLRHRLLLGSCTLGWPAAAAAAAAPDAALPDAAVRCCLARGLQPASLSALGRLMQLTFEHSLLLVCAAGKLHIVNLLRLWRMASTAADRSFFRPELPGRDLLEGGGGGCPVAALWTVDASDLAGVSLRPAEGGGGGILATISLASGAAVSGVVPGCTAWTGRRLEPRDRWRPPGPTGALRLVRLLEALQPGRGGLLRFRAGGGGVGGGDGGTHPHERPDGPEVLRRALIESGLAARGKSDCLLASCLQAFADTRAMARRADD